MSCWFHNYKELKEEIEYKFYGETCKGLKNTNYRICKKCHNIQEYHYTSRGGTWRNLIECKGNVIKKYTDLTTFKLSLPSNPRPRPKPSDYD